MPVAIRSRDSIRGAARRALAPVSAPVPWLSGPSLPQRLDAARSALAAARDDFERLRIRDGAAAIRAAAEVLQRRDVQVAAAELVADAERAIAQANPPRPPADRGQGRKSVAPGATDSGPAAVAKDALAKMRRAHSMPDADYERMKAEARERGEPLTRAVLLERRRRTGRRATTTPRTTSAPAAAELRANLVAARDIAAEARDARDAARALGAVARIAVLLGEAVSLLDALPAARRRRG